MTDAFLIGGTAFYFLAWLFLLLKKQKIGMSLYAFGWFLNVVAFVRNWMVAGEPPFGNMYHVQVVLAGCFLPLFALPRFRKNQPWSSVYFAFVSMLPLMGSIFMDQGAGWKRMPALQSHWFVPHVLAYMIAYALCGVAVAMLIVKRTRRCGSEYEVACDSVLQLAFPFMTFGLLSGAIWADDAWGVYWSWDPKETWALITWMLYAVYFHCRRSPWREFSDWAHLLAFLALLTTFFLVNLLPKLSSALHSYA